MAALFFLVQCAVGVLRPIKNAIALDGLGGANFYRVYLVSAAVALFVAPYTRMIERVPWRRLVTGMALFFALNLLLFRALYHPGSKAFGLIFYGWNDLFTAAVVSQFFLAAQYMVDARSAKRAYPMLIAGGSIGAAAGGAVTGFLAPALGTPNLLLVAAGFIVLFGLALPLTAGPEQRPVRRRSKGALSAGGLREVARDPHIRLVALMVLVTILVKQIVDYQFNALTKETFVTRDAVSAFQGKFNFATQWLPLLMLAVLQPLLRRYGVGIAVLMLPAFMFVANGALAFSGTLAAGVFAKGTETTLRYSVERAGREILYLPVPEELKLRAKTWIDVALEEGLGKAAAAGFIFLLLQVMGERRIALVGMLLSLVWLALGMRVRRQYVRVLARSIEGRFASVRGLYGSLADGTTWPLVRRALGSDDPLQVAFALDLISESPLRDEEGLALELNRLLQHPSAEIRARALVLLERFPHAVESARIRARLLDVSPAVREAAVRAFLAASDNGKALEELLSSEQAAVRTAVLSCIARGDVPGYDRDAIRRRYPLRLATARPADAAERAELALAASALPGDAEAERAVEQLLDDPEPAVASTALLAAGRMGLQRSQPRLIAALARPDTRAAARTALAALGPSAIAPLAAQLLDTRAHPLVRRALPSVLARIPCAETVNTLLRAVLAPETEQLLDYRIIKALSKLRAQHSDLVFDTQLALEVVRREVAVADRYATARASLQSVGEDGGIVSLTRGALADAWRERCEGGFRCLGLIFPPDDIYRCYLALSGSTIARANAIEWLEQTVGYSLFRELQPILQPEAGGPSRGHAAEALRRLESDSDPWVAACAAAARRKLERVPERQGTQAQRMDLIETVFLFQRVDLLKDARSAHLALLASIAEDLAVERGTVLIREGEPTEALYVVTRGAVELRGVGGEMVVNEGGAFGTWALIDESPSLVEARATENTHVLRIRREEFNDLVSDHPELALGLLQGLARRIRSLVA